MLTEIQRKLVRSAASLLVVLGVLLPAAAYSSVSYTYDRIGRVTTALYDNGVCIVYTYDVNGNRTAQTINAAGSINTAVWGTGAWGCFNWSP